MDRPLRLFAALPLPEELVDRLVAVQRALDRHWPARSVRWVRRDQLHLTLRFYGNVPPADAPALAEALRGACAGTGPLELCLTGLGGFPDARRPRVVWAGVSGEFEPLTKLQARIEAVTGGYGDHQEARAFQPHLTLGRVAFQRGRPAGPESDNWVHGGRALGGWRATAVHLIRSELSPAGPRYTLLSQAFLPARGQGDALDPRGMRPVPC